MKKYPCVFSSSFIREQIDPRIKELWPGKAPFGELRRLWQTTHCPLINPYGSDSCPYATEDCAMAFLLAVEKSVDKESPVGYFKSLARSYGIDRAEQKPLARDAIVRTYGQSEGPGRLRKGPVPGPHHVSGSHAATHTPGIVARDGSMGVRRPDHRPQRIGSLLRGDDPGPRTHAYRGDEREASRDHDGDRRDRVHQTPSDGSLGDKPSPGDPGVHQGGE